LSLVRLTLPVRDVVPATPRASIVTLDLGAHVFGYAPGQAVLVGAHGNARRRPYSLASAPEDAQRDRALELLVGTDAGVGPDTPFVPAAGALVDVEGPIGSFTFPANPANRHFLFVAGGTGIAPLRAMLRHALMVPHATIGLVYSARTSTDFAYGDELTALAEAGRIELRQAVTRSAPPDWPGARGRVSRALLEPLVHDPETLCFVCGPPTLVDEVSKLLEQLGVDRARIRVEGTDNPLG
jgi:ferredoxin-NADP reductase